MKKLTMAIFFMVSISVVAQGRNFNGERNAMLDLSPDQIATLQTKKMTLSLDLNDSQQSKMKTLLTQSATTRKTRMDELKELRKENREMTANEKFTMENKRLDFEIAQKKEMKSILTAEQFAKWEQMKHRKRAMHRKERRNKNGSK